MADQPGAAIFWSGLVVAVVLGLLIRGLLNPVSVRQQVEVAAGRIHPSLQVQFETAEVSLARGLFPRFSVIISQVQMRSTSPCWMAPVLVADEIRLPISLISWAFRGSPFRAIEAGDVEIRLTQARPAACDEGDLIASTPAAPAPSRGGVRIVRENLGETRTSVRTEGAGDIDSVQMGRLLLVSEVWPKASLDFSDFDLSVRAAKPLNVSVRSQLLIASAPGVTDSALRAQLEVDYREFPERQFDFRINGRLREGSYQLNGSFEGDTEQIKMEASLRSIPLVGLFDLLKDRNETWASFKPRLSWLSLKASTSGSARDLEKLELALSDLRLEGDLGEITSERLQILSWRPLRLEPSLVKIERLDFDRFFQFLGRSHPTPIFNRLGRFQGEVELQDLENFRMRGQHSGLELIFSNLGQRELQTLSKMSGEIERRGGRWTAKVSEVEIDRGSFEGEIAVRASQALDEIDLDLKARRFTVSPAVQTLMTSGGQVAPIQSQLKVGFRQGELRSMQGTLELPRLQVSGAELQGLRLDFRPSGREIEMKTQLQAMSLPMSWLKNFGMSEGILSTLNPGEGQLQVQQLQSTARIHSLNHVEWSRLQGRANSQIQFTSQGAWQADGALSGRFDITRSGRRLQAYRIEGQRSQPQLVEVER